MGGKKWGKTDNRSTKMRQYILTHWGVLLVTLVMTEMNDCSSRGLGDISEMFPDANFLSSRRDALVVVGLSERISVLGKKKKNAVYTKVDKNQVENFVPMRYFNDLHLIFG